MRKTLLASIGTLAFAPAATAAPPLVPLSVQKAVRAQAKSLAYVPTRAPRKYAYVSYGWSGKDLVIRLADKRFPLDGMHTILFTVEHALGLCSEGKIKTMQLDGNRVFWDGTEAWRCIRGARVSASGLNLPDSALGRVVASAKSLNK